MSFLHALQRTTTRHDFPYPHWEIEQPVGDDVLKETAATFVSDGPRAYDGTRAADNGGGGKDAKLRCYVGPDNVDEFPAIGKLIADLLDPATIECVEQMIDRDLSNAHLRVEVICDRKGFWLKPHKDIKEKLMSMLIYVNPHQESESLGTDIYDSNLQVVKTIPYRDNYAYMFAPGDNTWHGLEMKEIAKERRSILVNYVTFETGWKLPKFSRRKAAA